ncbi:MAG: nucleoside-diphosphate kinase, partial [Clostridia bacterium]
LDDHYAHLVDISKYPYIVGYMTSGNVVGFVIEGNDGIVAKIRELVGPRYDPPKKTIRGDFGFGDTTKNVVHSSDSIENAEKEIKRFFVDFKKFGIKDCTFLNEQRLDNC